MLPDKRRKFGKNGGLAKISRPRRHRRLISFYSSRKRASPPRADENGEANWLYQHSCATRSIQDGRSRESAKLMQDALTCVVLSPSACLSRSWLLLAEGSSRPARVRALLLQCPL